MADEYTNAQKLAAVTAAFEEMFKGDDATDVTYDGETKPSVEKRFKQIIDDYGNIVDLTAAAEAAAGAAAASGEIYNSTADALSNGVYSLDSLVAGSGGTDGTYPLAFSGGGGSGAAGWFAVASGAVSTYQITARGVGYTSAPAVSFAASAGLTGASADAVIATNREVGDWFWLPGSSAAGALDLYEVTAGPVATYRRSTAARAVLDAIAASFGAANGSYKWLAENATEEIVSFEGPSPKKSGWVASTGFSGYVAGFEFDDYDHVDKLSFMVDGLDNGDTLRLRLFSRYKASSYHDEPDVTEGDTLIDTVDLTSLPASASGVRVRVEFPVDLPVDADHWYLAEVQLLNSGSPADLGIQASNTPTASDQELRGYYRNLSDAWAKIATADVGIDVRCISLRAASPEPRLDRADELINSLVDGFGNSRPAIAGDALNGKATDGKWNATQFDAWGVFRDFDTDEYLHSVVISLNGYQTPETESVNFKIYEGPADFDKDDISDVYLIYEVSVPVLLSDAQRDVEFLVKRFVDSSKRYLFTFEGRDSVDTVSGLGVARFDAAAESAPMRGVFRTTGSGVWLYPSPYGVWAETISYAPDITKTFIDQLADAFNLEQVTVFQRPFTGGYWNTSSATFKGWAVGYNPVTVRRAKSVAMWLSNITSNTAVVLSVIRRPLGDAEAAPGAGTNDLTVLSREYTPADLGVAGAGIARVEVDISVLGELSPDYIYFFRFAATDGLLGCGQSNKDLADTPYWRRGYFSSNGTTYGAVGGSNSIAIEIYEDQYVVRERDVVAAATVHPSVNTVPTADGLSIAVPASEVVCSGFGRVAIAEQTLAIDEAASATTSETVNLRYDTSQVVFNNINPSLDYRYISEVTVTRDSDSAVLTEGVDYDVFYQGGKVYGRVNTPDFSVTVDYTYHSARYDLVEVDPASGAISVVEGTERTFDPEEYLPAGTIGRIPIAHVFVSGARTEVIRLSNWQYGVREGAELEQQALRKWGRQHLVNSLAKLSNGEAITIAGYGDSISAIQLSPPSYNTPNGALRDRPEGYFFDMPADTQAAIELFDHGDGAGQVHCHEGWNWRLVEHFEAHGCDVTYLNYAIGGTNSGNYNNGGNDRGGTDPDRLAALTGSGADLVVVAFGMNEINSGATVANVAQIVSACKAQGMEVVVLGCPRINALGGRASEQQWAGCNQRLWLAAQHAGAAYVSTQFIEETGAAGYSGLSAESFCNANMYNHPGPAQLRAIGRWLVELFV